MEADVARAFRDRPHLVDDQPGFLGMEVFTAAEDPAVFHLVTRWTDVESYRRWHHGEPHRLSHQWIPKGLKLDPEFTALQILDRLEPEDADAAPAASDGAMFAASFLAESAVVCSLRCDLEGRVLGANEALARMLELPIAELAGESVFKYLAVSEEEPMRERLRAEGRSPGTRFLAHFVSASDAAFTLSCRLEVRRGAADLMGEPAEPQDAAAKFVELNNELTVLARESARRAFELERTKSDLQRSLDELNASHWHLRKIQEVLPICMDCGKVKTGVSRWEDVAEYLRENSLFLSHGYCPECGEREMARVAAGVTAP